MPWWAVLLVIVLAIPVGVFGAYKLVALRDLQIQTGEGITGIFQPPFGGARYARILMIGVDNTGSKKIDDDSGLSDTLVVFAIDTKTKEIRGISVPRDTRVEIPGHRPGKINAAHAFGGPDLAVETVSKLLGCPIEYYVKTTVTGLVKLVDMAGGVYIKVDKDMHYVDRHGGLYINLKAKPEKQLLNGTQAMGYVRFRHDVIGDYGYKIENGKKVPMGRVVRHQYFFRALANRMLALPTKQQRMEFLTKALDKRYIVSNLKTKDWQGLMDAAKDYDPEKIVMDCLPSKPNNIRGVSYVIPDEEEIPVLVARNLLFQGTDPSSPGGDQSVTVQTPPVDTSPVTVQVLNASNRSGLAKSVADQLTKAGFVIINVGNAKKSSSRTCTIYSKKGDGGQIAKLAQSLGCSTVDTETSISGTADVTVVLGRSFDPRVLASLPSTRSSTTY